MAKNAVFCNISWYGRDIYPFRNVPDLLIRPEGFFDKVAGAFGFDDIDFESEEFSRAFFVKSSDKRFAYDVLHPRMLELLMAERNAAGATNVWRNSAELHVETRL